MARIILFDLDETLISQLTLGDEVRKLFFPETTKSVIEDLIKQGDHIIISSSHTSREAIIKSLNAAKIDTDKIEVLGGKETKVLPEEEYGGKVTKALESMQMHQADSVIIIEDSTRINASHKKVVHIQVPYQLEKPPVSDSYLKAVLLSDEKLFAMKGFIEKIKKEAEAQRDGMISSVKLDNYYKQVMVGKCHSKNNSTPWWNSFITLFGIFGNATHRRVEMNGFDTVCSLDTNNQGATKKL